MPAMPGIPVWISKVHDKFVFLILWEMTRVIFHSLESPNMLLCPEFSKRWFVAKLSTRVVFSHSKSLAVHGTSNIQSLVNKIQTNKLLAPNGPNLAEKEFRNTKGGLLTFFLLPLVSYHIYYISVVNLLLVAYPYHERSHLRVSVELGLSPAYVLMTTAFAIGVTDCLKRFIRKTDSSPSAQKIITIPPTVYHTSGTRFFLTDKIGNFISGQWILALVLEDRFQGLISTRFSSCSLYVYFWKAHLSIRYFLLSHSSVIPGLLEIDCWRLFPVVSPLGVRVLLLNSLTLAVIPYKVSSQRRSLSASFPSPRSYLYVRFNFYSYHSWNSCGFYLVLRGLERNVSMLSCRPKTLTVRAQSYGSVSTINCISISTCVSQLYALPLYFLIAIL